MPTIVTEGDRLLSVTGRRTSMKRPSVPFSAYAGGGGVALTSGGSISYASLFRRQPWVAVVVNKLARQIARLPLKVYRLDSKGDRERVREHALVDLLARPWPRGSASDLKQALGFPTLLHGNGLIAKSRERRGGPPTELVPLDWRFAIAHFEQGEPIRFWETQQTGVGRFIAPEEVVHTAWWAPDGPLGVSPLQQLGVTIALEDAAQRYSTASFDNAVRPGGAFVLPPEAQLDREERQELRDEITHTHGGVDQAFRFLLLSGGVDFKPLSQTAVEAELVLQRKLNREEVAAVYDVPPPLIGILDHATYSNVSEMHRMLYMTVLGPWLDLIEQTLQAQLIDPEPAFEGLFCEFDLSEVLKGDTRQRVLALKDGIGTGLYTINEARKVENLPRIDHPTADQPLIPQNNLAPLGEEPAGDVDSPMLAAHFARARDRVLTRLGAGEEPAFDGERFERELAEDLGNAPTARRWREALEKGTASGDPGEIKQFFKALGA